MDFNQYQQQSTKTATYPRSTEDFDDVHTTLYSQTLWMSGFVGSVCNQIKKMMRDDNGLLTEDRKEKLDKDINSAIQALGWIGQSIGKEENKNENVNLGNDIGLCYTSLGLMGEVGEVLGKATKIYEAKSQEEINSIKDKIKDELGDVLWYISACIEELGTNLDEIASSNLEKLNSRKERNVISGDGDER